MENSKMFMLSAEKSLNLLQFQTIYQFDDGERLIRAFNILKNGKLIRKFYLNELVKTSCEMETEELITNMIIQCIVKPDIKKTAPENKHSKTKSTVNPQARAQATNNFLNNLDLK